MIAGFQLAAMLILTMRAVDGTPFSFNANIIQKPGGASAALVGAWMRRREPSRTNVSSTKRCSMFQLCVTDAVLTIVTRLMLGGVGEVDEERLADVDRSGRGREARLHRARTGGVVKVRRAGNTSMFMFCCGPGAPPPPTSTRASGSSSDIE